MSEQRRPPVLYVDDEQSNLTVFQAAYEDEYEVSTAVSAREALHVLKERPIEVIVTDQRMPQMTGVQFLEAVSPTYPDVVKIILTGFTDVEAIIRAINTGRVHQYVTKPFDIAAMGVILDRALELREMQMRNRELVTRLEKAAAQARAVREAFQRHVPEPVVADMLADGGRSGIMAGDARLVAVMFCRIHAFRKLCARADPESLVGFLSAYVQVINGAVMRNAGLVSEMINDEVMSVFGAPISSLENEQNAVQAAREIVGSLDQLNEAAAVPLLGDPVRLGIGIDRGEVIAGNIGSIARMKYGAVGDTVNVASRIQQQTSGDRNEIIISGSVKEWLEPHIGLENIGPTELRGRSGAVDLYRVQV
ncbi:MAG: adenylate/guanylate cyclase domain-containing protein [Gemmatimonadota bacterium]|jgi:adenylate cyclase